jgi:hypothetical protein
MEDQEAQMGKQATVRYQHWVMICHSAFRNRNRAPNS